MIDSHTIHRVLDALASGGFRRLTDLDYEAFAGAGPLALIWYTPSVTFILDPGANGVHLGASFQRSGAELVYDWSTNKWEKL